jgi:hypothetical protein
MGAQFELYVMHDAPEDVLDFCVYQRPPDSVMPNAGSLAWLVMTAHRGTTLHFTWTVDYSFLWAQSGILQPGVPFEASQIIPADLSTNNQVVFDYAEGAYLFEEGIIPGITPEQGTLYVQTSPVVPANDASVGIGMSGAGTFAAQAEPGMVATFTPHPAYGLAAGDYTQGEVIDIEHITDPVAIEFPDGQYVMTATLDGENLWTVTPGKPTVPAVAGS